jgi:hypothetical protein
MIAHVEVYVKWLLDALAIFVLVWLLSILGGCAGDRKSDSTANAIPATVHTYEVPLSDTSTIPDILCLLPGQTARLEEDIVVFARVPFQGRALYIGEVKLEKGTMLVKPKVEGDNQ